MTDAEIAARLINALSATAEQDAQVKTALVSVTIEMLSAPRDGRIEPRIVRRTRTLVFATADLIDAAGVIVATAASVHKVPSEGANDAR